jgi:sortase A
MTERKKSSNAPMIGLVVVGLMIVVFSFGKSVIDLINAPVLTIDLVQDDQIESGFLPVYIEEDTLADVERVAINPEDPQEAGDSPVEPPVDPQAFPTQVPEAVAEIAPENPGLVPQRILIPSIELDASVIPVEFANYEFEGKNYQQWLAPEGKNVGWHKTSAGLGVAGNTVLNGHHNIKGMVFRDLYQVQVGDNIEIDSASEKLQYVVVYTDILAERNQPLDVRLANAEWIKNTGDERLTIITCWPFESNTHRVVVVAVPVRLDQSSSLVQ